MSSTGNNPNTHEELNGGILRNEKERIANIQMDMTESQKHAEQKQAGWKEYTLYDSFQMKSETTDLTNSDRKYSSSCPGPKVKVGNNGKGAQENFLEWRNILYFDCGDYTAIPIYQNPLKYT